MAFFERLTGPCDLQKQLSNTILDQNRYLAMLKEEPLSAKYGAQDYLTQPGQARLEPAQGDAERLLACADKEMQQPQFYEDNKYWLMDEVERYMRSNQEQLKEQKRQAQIEEEQRLQKQQEEEERLAAASAAVHEGIEPLRDNEAAIGPEDVV